MVRESGKAWRVVKLWRSVARWWRGETCLPNVPELLGELTTPTYTVREDGKFQIEAKEQVKERLGRSPDLADVLALTFAHSKPAARRNPAKVRAAMRRLERDFNPEPGLDKDV